MATPPRVDDDESMPKINLVELGFSAFDLTNGDQSYA
jgi:hypothetical protein